MEFVSSRFDLGVRDRLDVEVSVVGERVDVRDRGYFRGLGYIGESLLTVTERAPSLAHASSAGAWASRFMSRSVQTTSKPSTLTLASSSPQAAASSMEV